MFKEATEAAPADADFVAYSSLSKYVVAMRTDDGWEVIANTTFIGYGLLAVGIGQVRKSLWDHERQQFDVGTVEQMMRDQQHG